MTPAAEIRASRDRRRLAAPPSKPVLPPSSGELERFVLAWIEKRLGITLAQLRSPRKLKEFVEARCLATWALRNLARPWTYQRIANLLSHGGQGHFSNASYWSTRAAELRVDDAEFGLLCVAIREDFQWETFHHGN